MAFLIFVGVISFVFGALFLFSPNAIRRLNALANKVLADIDEKAYNLRTGIGISLLLVSCLAFLMVYYIIIKYG
jgi:uncharacterized BrkB/YihY/UPF0761 family membrane protein